MMRLGARGGIYEAGFTLLEMIVVLVILALAAAIVGPRTGRVTPQVELRASVQRLAADLRIARAEALRTSAQRAVIIDPTTRAYWSDPKATTALSGRLGVRVARSDLSTDGGGAREISGPLRIVFAPDGSSSGGSIVLSAGPLTATVTVDWLTGATRVAWGR